MVGEVMSVVLEFEITFVLRLLTFIGSILSYELAGIEFLQFMLKYNAQENNTNSSKLILGHWVLITD